MTREQLSFSLALALNLLANLDPSNWTDQQHQAMRMIQDNLPERVDLDMQNADPVNAKDLLSLDGK